MAILNTLLTKAVSELMKTITQTPRFIGIAGALLGLLITGNALSSDSHDAPAPAAASTTAAPKPKTPAPGVVGDDQMSKALFEKINKGSGDIVIRTGDLPAGAAPIQGGSADKPKSAKTAAKLADKNVHDVHWSYLDGPGGPENWGNLSKENLACTKGKTQSPININVDRVIKAELPPLEFLYRPSPVYC